MKRAFLFTVTSAALFLAASLALTARGPNPNAIPTTAEVSERIMSPFCPGLTLSECPSSQSAELRARIAQKIEDAWTNRRIDDWLVASYGEAVLARPRRAVAFVVPIGALLAATALVVLLIARWSGSERARTNEAGEPAPSIDSENEGASPTESEKERLASELALFAEGTE